MENPSNKSEAKPDIRANGNDDSRKVTIEYLRARLLSERSVSKAAKERVDELAKRVAELEEQLKTVTIERQRAEKATLDVLSFLASRGISDIYEVYESGSGEEEEEGGESLCESNVGKDDDDDDENDDDNDSNTPSSSRSLSWKGRKGNSQFIQRRTSIARLSPSPRHHTGKSCRQIKRRETRSPVQESRHDSAKSDADDNNAVNSPDNLMNCSKTGSEDLERFSKERVYRDVQKKEVLYSFLAEAQDCDASSSTRNYECSGGMERALEHQAQLVGRYEAEEKAQKDWEEKYGENTVSTPDSYEPGNHSDITEERDENKAVRETQFHGKESSSISHFNSFKLTPHEATAYSQNSSEMRASGSPTPDFAFSTINSSHQTQEHSERPSNATQNCAHLQLVPLEEPHRLGPVLGALQEAKLLINQKMNTLEATSGSVGKCSEDSIGTGNADWLQVPVGCPGLFRVPTHNVQSQVPSHGRLVGSNYSSLTNSYLYSGRTVSQHDQYYVSSPMGPNMRIDPGISTRQSMLMVPSSYSTFPDFFPHMSSNQLSFNLVPRGEVGIPSSRGALYYEHDVRPNMYR